MGSYLSCGIATEVSVKKKKAFGIATKDEIVSKLSKKLKLDIYDVEEDKDYVNFIIKKEIFEKNAVSFIKEQFEKSDYYYMDKADEGIHLLEEKSYDELIDIANKRSIVEFQNIGGVDVSYISNGEFTCLAEMVIYLSDGKIFMECYYEIFKYLRESIIQSNTNPIKDAVMIAITG